MLRLCRGRVGFWGNSVDVVKLGILVPYTGVVSAYGQEIAQAAKIAGELVNESGGILGCPLEVVVADDGSVPESAVPAARDLLAQGCHGLVGNLLSNTRISVANTVAAPAGIPMLNYSFNEGSIYTPTYFNFAALPNQQIEKLIPYLADKVGKKMYFAGNNYEWPRGSIHAAIASLSHVAGEVLGEDYLPLGASPVAINELISRLSVSGAEVFVPYFAGDDQIAVMRAITAAGLKNRMAVVTGHFDAAMAMRLSPQERAGIYVCNTYFMNVDTPMNQLLLKRVAAQSDVDGLWPRGNGFVTNFGEGAFCCVLAFAEAANKAGSVSPEAISEALASVTVSSAQGEVRMDPATHNASVNTYLAQCNEAGDLQIVKSFGLIAPQIPKLYQDLYPAADEGPARQASPFSDIVPEVVAAAAFSATAASVVVADSNGLILQVNDAALSLFQYPREQLLGHSILSVFPPGDRKMRGEQLRSIAGKVGHEQLLSIAGYRFDGSYLQLDARLSGVSIAEHPAIVLTARDIEGLESTRHDLLWVATHDGLTALPNRNQIRSRLDRALERASMFHVPVGVLFLDLDGFKRVNDVYGHETGDRLLQGVADRISASLPMGTTLGRQAGDEFLIIVENEVSVPELERIGLRLVQALQNPIDVGGLGLRITASIGSAISDTTLASSESLISAADAAMYCAKRSGKGLVRHFTRELSTETSRQADLERILLTGIPAREVNFLLQPICALPSNQVAGQEVLMRWDSAIGQIEPEEFMSIMEAAGSITSTGLWALETACAVAGSASQHLSGANDRPPFVTCNISPQQLVVDDFMTTFHSLLSSYKTNPGALHLEFTETAFDVALDIAPEVLRQCRDLGVGLAIDKFGTGKIPVIRLAELPISLIKVDRLLINRAPDNANVASICAAIVNLAHEFGAQSVAVGVETTTQLHLAEQLGFEFAQGNLLSKPHWPQQYGDQPVYPKSMDS